MSKKTPVVEIARKSDLTVQSTDRISSVYRLMKSRSLAHITVFENNEIVGIISRKAIKQLGFGYEFDGHDDVETGMFDMRQAQQAIGLGPPQVALSATVGEGAGLGATGAYTARPVVHGGRPVGSRDIRDSLPFLLETR